MCVCVSVAKDGVTDFVPGMGGVIVFGHVYVRVSDSTMENVSDGDGPVAVPVPVTVAVSVQLPVTVCGNVGSVCVSVSDVDWVMGVVSVTVSVGDVDTEPLRESDSESDEVIVADCEIERVCVWLIVVVAVSVSENVGCTD